VQASFRGKTARIAAVKKKGIVERERADKAVHAMGIAKSVSPEESLYLLMQVAKDVQWRLKMSGENPRLERRLTKCMERCATARQAHCRTFADGGVVDKEGNPEEEALFEYLDALHELEAILERETGRPAGRAPAGSHAALVDKKARMESGEPSAEMAHFEQELKEYLAVASQQAQSFADLQGQLHDYKARFDEMNQKYGRPAGSASRKDAPPQGKDAPPQGLLDSALESFKPRNLEGLIPLGGAALQAPKMPFFAAAAAAPAPAPAPQPAPAPSAFFDSRLEPGPAARRRSHGRAP